MGRSIRRFLIWVVFHVPLGPLAPWVLGLALGRRPRRIGEVRRAVDVTREAKP